MKIDVSLNKETKQNKYRDVYVLQGTEAKCRIIFKTLFSVNITKKNMINLNIHDKVYYSITYF